MPMKCVIPSCNAEGQILHRFPKPRKRSDEFKHWLKILRIDELYSLTPEKVYDNRRICSAHFDASCKSPGNPRLHRNAVPTIGVPVIQEVGVTEFVKGAVPHIFNNDTIANSKESSKPVETNENNLQNKSAKIVEEPEVTPAPILFVSSCADYKEEEVLTSSNKQPDSDCAVLNKITVQYPRYTGQRKVKDLESPMEREKNWNLAMNEISALRKKVNILQNRNRRLDRRVRSMKTLLRHFKKTHAR